MDNGHEFQAKFQWHVKDKGMRHAYIKPRSPQLNGKVELSHRSDQQEFYQLLGYTGDVDLNAKRAEWEKFYNFARPHGAHNGKNTLRGSSGKAITTQQCVSFDRLHYTIIDLQRQLGLVHSIFANFP
jgi:hypothetical protein